MKKAIAMFLCLVLLAASAMASSEADESVFDILSGLNWSYCSGAGAWSSDMTIRIDGSFICNYHDSDMGDSADAYPNGTVYFADFTGRVSLTERTEENTWKIRVDELKREPAEEQIEDGVRYVPAEVCGLSEGDIMTLYAPGTPAGVLSEDMQFWAHVMDQEDPETLENWFLASEKNESGFVGYRTADIVNPWLDLTAEQLEEVSGLRFGVPEGAEDIIYRYLPEEGLATMQFTREKEEYCIRGQKRALSAADRELIDISGMYFDWDDEEEIGFGNCYGVFGRAQTGTENWVERILWYDPDRAILYALAVYTTEPGSLDLAGVAEKIMEQ